MYKKIFLLLFFLTLFSSVNAFETVIFNDNFDDGSIADWDVNAGVWSGASFYLDGGALDPAMISHSVTGMTAGRTYRIYYKDKPITTTNQGRFYWFTNDTGVEGVRGYNVVITDGFVRLIRSDGPTTTNLISVAGVSLNNYHDVNVTHAYDGNISLWIDGTYKGSVVDTTYRSGTKIFYATANGANNHNVDDINILFTGDTNTIFKVVDEITNIGIPSPTITINGIGWPAGIDGNFDVNNSITFPATITVSKTDYSTRTFNFDTNQGLYEIRRFGLRDSNATREIDFQFFAPDETTKLSNRVIKVTRNGILAGRNTSDSEANISFVLASQDPIYDFNIMRAGTDYGDTNNEYQYDAVTVTVNRPKDEATNVDIFPNSFNMDVGGLGLQNYSAQTLPISTIIILGNTFDVYTLRIVDNNVDGQQYFARNYIMQTKGNDTSLTIQPYLIGINDGILVNLKVADLSTNQTIPNIRIQMKLGIGGSNNVVEDKITDSAGIAQVVMLSQKTYDLIITSMNQDINYFNGPQPLSPSSQSFTIWINYSASSVVINQKNTLITIAPSTTAIINNPQRIDVNVDTNATHDFIYVKAYDSNRLVDQNNCSASPCHVSLTMNFNNFDTNFLNIEIIIQNEDFNFTRTINYYTAPFLNNIVSRVQNLKNEVGPVTLGVIMFAVIFGLIAFLGSNGLGNNMSQIFLIVIVAGVFYFLWFYDVTKLFGGELFVAFLAGVFGVMLIYFWARQKGGP